MAKDRDIFKWFIHSVLFEPSPGYGFAPGALALYPGTDPNIVLNGNPSGFWGEVKNNDTGFVTYIYIDDDGTYGPAGKEYAETAYYRFNIITEEQWGEFANENYIAAQILDYYESVTPDRFQWWNQIAFPTLRYKDRIPLESYGQAQNIGLLESRGLDPATFTSPLKEKDKADITPLIFAAIGGVTGGAPGALAGFLFSLVTQQKDKAEKQKTVSTEERVTASSVGLPSGIGFNI